MNLKTVRRILVAIALAALPFVFIALRLSPATFAGYLGCYYGSYYTNDPNVPEVSANPPVTFGIDQTNASTAGGCPVGPISYQDGVPEIRTVGLSVPSAGVGASFHLSYNANMTGASESVDDGNVDLPYGWNWHSPIPQLVQMSSTEIRAVMRGKGYRYTLSSGTWEGAFGVDATIKYVGSKYVLYGTNGSVAHFHNFSESYKPGAPDEIFDAYGNRLVFSYYNDYQADVQLRGKLRYIYDKDNTS